MCVVDLYSGRAELIKIGASPSFHVRQSRVDVVGAGSLPAGIMDEISVFTVSRDFAAGDILVMVTDGVTDVYRGAEEKEEWITTVLREIVDLPAREVADLILRLAQSGAGDRKNADDMTVLVARVEKSN
jgi:stage II sporulation protein E